MNYIFVTDEELTELPENKELATMEYFNIVTKKLAELTDLSNSRHEMLRIKSQYIVDISVLMENYGSPILGFRQILPGDDDFDEQFEAFSLEVKRKISKIRLEMRGSDDFRKEILAPRTKLVISNYIIEIKSILINSNLERSRKKILIEKIDEFEFELNSSRSNLKKILTVLSAIAALSANISRDIPIASELYHQVSPLICGIMSEIGVDQSNKDNAKQITGSRMKALPAPDRGSADPSEVLAEAPDAIGSNELDDIPF